MILLPALNFTRALFPPFYKRNRQDLTSGGRPWSEIYEMETSKHKSNPALSFPLAFHSEYSINQHPLNRKKKKTRTGSRQNADLSSFLPFSLFIFVYSSHFCSPGWPQTQGVARTCDPSTQRGGGKKIMSSSPAWTSKQGEREGESFSSTAG